MELLLARHLWGVSSPYATSLKKFKDQGYAAIETGLLYLQEPKKEFLAQLNDLALQWIPMIFTTGSNVKEHLASFTAQIKEVSLYKPLLINAHSGRDAFTRAEAHEFYREALNIEHDIGIPIAHETHRSRIFYNPWTTKEILQEFTDLKICCDYSHWVAFCERLIDDEEELLQLCAERCLHLHARVGYEQGPQVPDPRAPEYQLHVETHERWWNMIWDAQKKSGRKFTTLTPEFGPAPYMQLQPHSASTFLEDICLWQMQRQRSRFAQKFNNGE